MKLSDVTVKVMFDASEYLAVLQDLGDIPPELLDRAILEGMDVALRASIKQGISFKPVRAEDSHGNPE